MRGLSCTESQNSQRASPFTIDRRSTRLVSGKFFVHHPRFGLRLLSDPYSGEIAGQDGVRYTGQYQCKCMSFGLANAPSVFQRTMNKVLAKAKFARLYMDDVLIPARSFTEGLERLEEVLKLLSENGLTLKLSKCNFFYEEIDFLGFKVSGRGIRPESRKIAAISNFPVPVSLGMYTKLDNLSDSRVSLEDSWRILLS